MCVNGHILMTFQQLTGLLSCFASVSSKTVPLPSGLTDKAEAVRMMRGIVMAFKPLLTDSAAAFTHLLHASGPSRQ